MKKSERLVYRLLSAIRVSSAGCFEWQRGRNEHGYGRVFYCGRNYSAHRLSYMAFRGHIPVGLFVCHKCDNPCCINPAHLFLGTGADNVRDAKQKGRLCSGESRPDARLTNIQVLEICRRYDGGESSGSLSAEYGLSNASVTAILRGEKWVCVTDGFNRVRKKLDADSVKSLREMALRGVSDTEIARQLGVDRSTVSYARRMKTWSKVS